MTLRVLGIGLSVAAVSAFAQTPAPAAPAPAAPTAAAPAPAAVPAIPAALTATPAVPAAPVAAPANSAAPVTVAQVTAPAADRAAVPAATPALPGAPELAVQPAAAGLPQAVLAAAERPLPTLVPFTAPTRGSAAAKARRARLAKGSSKKRRGPASIVEADPDALQIFDENTSFESLVLNRQKTARNPAAFQPQARIIAVRRELALTEADANAAPQDIVLNAGTENGLDEGMVLSVARSVPILDPYRENQQKQLEIEFAKVRVIHAQPNLAIARLDKIDSIRKGLAVGTRAVLIGDYVGKFTK